MAEWLLHPDNGRVVAAMATLLAATLATTTALAIAFVAYPIQKNKDRKLEIEKEKRRVYGSFCAQLNQLEFEADTLEEFMSPKSNDFWTTLSMLALYASPKVTDLAFTSTFLAAAAKANSEQKLDLANDLESLGLKLEELQVKKSKTENELVAVMRAETALAPLKDSEAYLEQLDGLRKLESLGRLSGVSK